MDENRQKEPFSNAYLRAVVATAGFSMYKPEVDDESVDWRIGARGGGGTTRSPKMELQLKCTSREVLKDGHVAFPLKVKNYNDFRHTDYQVPRILVVVLVPQDVSAWIAQSEDSLALRPCGYWLSSGWTKTQEKSGHWTVWVRRDETGEEYEVSIPLVSTFRDFALRMGDVLGVLEVVERRSQLEILRDLFIASADVVRVRLTDHELADGTVPIEGGAQFFQKAKDLMLAAACATAGPRAYFPSRKPHQATEYLRRTRLGQTEQGSFVLTIISHVPPSLTGKNGELLEAQEPFERRVMQTLAHALEAVRKAAEDAAASGQVASFVDAVDQGVSANLCDAIVGMGRCSEVDRNLALHFSWARSRPVPPTVFPSNSIFFPADALPVIEEAGHHLKESSPQEEFEAIGPVVRLERGEGAATGRVTIHCFIDGQPRKVSLELCDSDYHLAVTAHDHGQSVRCGGVLVREGRTLRLNNPFAFRAVTEE